ncbi:RAMP superfamily CRISPR-associated protein [Heliophilum fasciatum]|uniref:RAMP superfamily protein n=1 Tax=Heliophilum fasciatum TaxID=35700 RepID=A0A4R2RCA5_9FIRM|nr:RAMP superfamily CRISPR-associated protein [Heliophilum fasciatum]MCW2279306.1 CRISPR/Cas system CSM-associated protein Csm3 (group 7 of RAMP superfamily) [Heliophilum fasciatum]TCP60433.1 RAMP superfamily protein [Heliophilum fasciatum]
MSNKKKQHNNRDKKKKESKQHQQAVSEQGGNKRELEPWKVTIQCLQPLAISGQPNGDNHWDALTYIPGSTWRGAIAEQWKYRVGFEHPLTQSFFQKGIWRDAHVVTERNNSSETFTSLDVYRCKQCGEKKSIIKEFVQFHESSTQSDLPNLICPNTSCQGPLLRVDSAYDEDVVVDEAVGIEINVEREATEPEKFYSLNFIAEGTRFETIAYLPAIGLEMVSDKDNTATGSPTSKDSQKEYYIVAYVGRRRSAGYGKVEIVFTQEKQLLTDNSKAMKMKIEAFNRALQDSPKDHKGVRGCDTWYVSIVNRSPMILLDPFLRPVSEMDPSLHWGKKLPWKVEKVLAWGLSGIRHGWSNAWHGPKTADWIIEPGSIHLFKFEGLDKSSKEKIALLMDRLERLGIGERTNEGFGQVEICRPISTYQLKPGEQTAIPQEEVNQLMQKAQAFAKLADQCRLRRSQLYGLHNLATKQLLDEIIGEDDCFYLQKRLNKKGKNAWKQQVRMIDENEEKKALALILRDYAKSWKEELGYREATRQVQEFINYIIGYYSVLKANKEE